MNDQFDTQTELYNVFSINGKLLESLEIPNETNEDILNSKIRRVMADTTVMTQEDTSAMPFFDFTFVPMSGRTGNFLVSKSTLEFNVYSSTWSSVELIYKAIHNILNNTYEDAQVYYSGQGSSGITGVIRYVFRVRHLTKS